MCVLCAVEPVQYPSTLRLLMLYGAGAGWDVAPGAGGGAAETGGGALAEDQTRQSFQPLTTSHDDSIQFFVLSNLLSHSQDHLLDFPCNSSRPTIPWHFHELVIVIMTNIK